VSIEIKIKKTKVAQALQRSIRDLEKHAVKVGWVVRDTYPGTLETVASVAAGNEFGVPAKRIPPRPFLRPTIAAKQNIWRRTIQHAVRQAIEGEIEPIQVWSIIGFRAQGHFQKAIKAVISPPLARYTIQKRIEKLARGSRFAASIEKPLIETGHMLTTLTHEVVEAT